MDWGAHVPQTIQETWKRWHNEISEFQKHTISQCYFPKVVNIVNIQLHGFSNASVAAYAGVVDFNGIDDNGHIHVSLVIAETKVAPIKPLTIPRLELCGAVVLAKLVSHVASILVIPAEQT